MTGWIQQGSYSGIPWAWTDPRDAAYRNPNEQGQAAEYSKSGLSGQTMRQFGDVGFNLAQWFTDQGVTDKSQMTYWRYAALRNIPVGESQYNYLGHLGQSNPYTYTGSGADNFTMSPQGTAEGVSVAPNGAAYTDTQAASLNSAKENRASRTRLNSVGTPTASNNPLGADAVLFRPTLLGGS